MFLLGHLYVPRTVSEISVYGSTQTNRGWHCVYADVENLPRPLHTASSTLHFAKINPFAKITKDKERRPDKYKLPSHKYIHICVRSVSRRARSNDGFDSDQHRRAKLSGTPSVNPPLRRYFHRHSFEGQYRRPLTSQFTSRQLNDKRQKSHNNLECWMRQE